MSNEIITNISTDFRAGQANRSIFRFCVNTGKYSKYSIIRIPVVSASAYQTARTVLLLSLRA